MELNKAKQQIKEADAASASQKAEIEKLNHIINEADHERVRQKKVIDRHINVLTNLPNVVSLVIGLDALSPLHVSKHNTFCHVIYIYMNE